MGYVRFFLEHKRFILFGLLLTLSSNCGQTFFISLSGGYLRQELQLTDGGFGFLYSAATLTSALILPVAGRWIDRTDLRVYSLAVYGGVIAGCFTMSFVSSTALLFVAFLLLRLFGQGLLGHTASTSMARYYDVGRGKAMSLASLGYPLGESFLPILAVLAMAEIGWRATWQAVGAIALLVMVPATVGLLRGHGTRHRELEERAARDRDEAAAESEEDAELELDPAPRRLRAGADWTRARVLRDRRFYLLLPAVLAPPFIGTGVFFHQVRICEAKEWPLELFASAFAVYAIGSVVASLIGGSLVDRFTGRRLLGGYLIPQALALAALATWDSPVTIFLYMAGAGITAGASSPVVGALWAELYGVIHLGAIRSAVTGLMVFSTACAPGPLGWLLDLGTPIALLAAIGAAACVLTSILAGLAARSRSPDL